MGDDLSCNIEGIGTVLIKVFDGMMRELREVRYVPQALGFEISVRDGVLKMTRGSMVVIVGRLTQ